MVNIYDPPKKSLTVPKPTGGYSSTMKPATAPMRQGGLSQLAAKAAAAGRQPTMGPPIPDTGRGQFAMRAQQAEEPGKGPTPQQQQQYTPGSGAFAGGGGGFEQTKGLLGGAAREAATRGLGIPTGGAMPSTGPVSRFAPAGEGRERQREDVGRAPTGAPHLGFPGQVDRVSYEARPEAQRAIDYGVDEEGRKYKFIHGKKVYLDDEGNIITHDPGRAGAAGYEGPFAFSPGPIMGGYGPAAAAALMQNPEFAERAGLVKEMTDAGVSSVEQKMVMDALYGDYGLSDAEVAKQVGEGAGIQAEMMAARGLGASGMVGTGFGDIYSKIQSENALLAIQDEIAKLKLASSVYGGAASRQLQERLVQLKEQEAKLNEAKILGWANEGEATSIHPSTDANYAKLKALKMSDADIKDLGKVVDGVYSLPETADKSHLDAPTQGANLADASKATKDEIWAELEEVLGAKPLNHGTEEYAAWYEAAKKHIEDTYGWDAYEWLDYGYNIVVNK